MNHLPFAGSFAATRILTGLTAFSVVAGMAGYTKSVIVRNNLIEPEEAASFALIDAGIREADAEDLHTVREYQNGQYVYRIQFSADNTQYTCIVEAKDGIVLAREPEDAPAAGNVSNTEQAASAADSVPVTEEAASAMDSVPVTEASQYITVDKAKQIALSAAGFREEDVIFSKSKVEDDDDHGRVYEIEFYRGNVEYEYEIDAVTGTIVESSTEIEDDDDD